MFICLGSQSAAGATDERLGSSSFLPNVGSTFKIYYSTLIQFTLTLSMIWIFSRPFLSSKVELQGAKPDQLQLKQMRFTGSHSKFQICLFVRTCRYSRYKTCFDGIKICPIKCNTTPHQLFTMEVYSK